MTRKNWSGPMVGVLCGMAVMVILSSNRSPAQATVAMGDPSPTVVGFSTSPAGWFEAVYLFRMWSDGTVEAKFVNTSHNNCSQNPGQWCLEATSWSPWTVMPDTAEGYACANDVDGNRVVNVNDILAVLDGWGSAPQCADLPDIECTLGMIN